ncbi:hypothetical protein BC831DRAFT_60559 [Entophlyctis helioformis]|nr:hypothetical protein BC831DRAFT_60559 [Entophlyctis helioformis]
MTTQHTASPTSTNGSLASVASGSMGETDSAQPSASAPAASEQQPQTPHRRTAAADKNTTLLPVFHQSSQNASRSMTHETVPSQSAETPTPASAPRQPTSPAAPAPGGLRLRPAGSASTRRASISGALQSAAHAGPLSAPPISSLPGQPSYFDFGLSGTLAHGSGPASTATATAAAAAAAAVIDYSGSHPSPRHSFHVPSGLAATSANISAPSHGQGANGGGGGGGGDGVGIQTAAFMPLSARSSVTVTGPRRVTAPVAGSAGGGTDQRGHDDEEELNGELSDADSIADLQNELANMASLLSSRRNTRLSSLSGSVAGGASLAGGGGFLSPSPSGMAGGQGGNSPVDSLGSSTGHSAHRLSADASVGSLATIASGDGGLGASLNASRRRHSIAVHSQLVGSSNGGGGTVQPLGAMQGLGQLPLIPARRASGMGGTVAGAMIAGSQGSMLSVASSENPSRRPSVAVSASRDGINSPDMPSSKRGSLAQVHVVQSTTALANGHTATQPGSQAGETGAHRRPSILHSRRMSHQIHGGIPFPGSNSGGGDDRPPSRPPLDAKQQQRLQRQLTKEENAKKEQRARRLFEYIDQCDQEDRQAKREIMEQVIYKQHALIENRYAMLERRREASDRRVLEARKQFLDEVRRD